MTPESTRVNPTAETMSASPDFGAFLEGLRAAVRDRLSSDWAEYRKTLFAIGDGFIDSTRQDLERWTGLLSVGALTREDFDWLVQGRRDLAEMEALRNAGLSLAQVDRLRAALVETVVSTAFRHFLPI